MNWTNVGARWLTSIVLGAYSTRLSFILTSLVLTPSSLLACGGAPGTSATSTSATSSPATSEETASPPPRLDRRLERDASFGDLVAVARELDRRRDQDSRSGCLIAVQSSGYRLDADLAVAVRPLPGAAVDLDERFAAETGPVAVLTRFGVLGRLAGADSAWVAMTTSLPIGGGAAVLLALTDQGVYARRTDGMSSLSTASRAGWMLEHLEWESLDWVVVSAESGVSLTDLVEFLEAIPDRFAGRILLATPLEPGTRLPEARELVDEAPIAAHCPDGLPLLDERAPLGELPLPSIRDGLQPLVSSAEVCVGVRTVPVSGSETVQMAIRIGPQGQVAEACVRDFETDDPVLHACLVRGAQRAQFESPNGYIDLELPLRLVPGPAQRQDAVCRE